MAYILRRQVKYQANASALVTSFPALFTEKGILLSHLKYLYSKKNKSQSWVERNTFSVYLLLKFINAFIYHSPSATELLSAFVNSLSLGTIENGYDKSGLFWHPRKNEDVNVLLGHINSYCDYLDEIYGNDLPQINPLKKTTKPEERLLWCAYYKRQSNCFLNHLNKPSIRQFSSNRHVQGPNRHLLAIEPVFRFSEEQIENLLNHGCIFNKLNHLNKQEDIASRLIIMLMHWGGLRLSECFHIFKHDINIDNKTGASLINVYHPSDGKSPELGFRNRREYLTVKHHLTPRNEYSRNHKYHAGWKAPLLTNRNLSFNVMFYPAHKSIEFTSALQLYLNIRIDGNHPYLFTNTKGYPESKKNFIKKYNRAITRIGLTPRKDMGTTPHAHRHSYGHRLKNDGFSQLEIQKAMHHKSPDSCLVYIAPTDGEIRLKMRGTYE